MLRPKITSRRIRGSRKEGLVVVVVVVVVREKMEMEDSELADVDVDVNDANLGGCAGCASLQCRAQRMPKPIRASTPAIKQSTEYVQ